MGVILGQWSETKLHPVLTQIAKIIIVSKFDFNYFHAMIRISFPLPAARCVLTT